MTQTDDYNDSSWHQAELDEQSLLSLDPGYFEFLEQFLTLTKGNKDVIS